MYASQHVSIKQHNHITVNHTYLVLTDCISIRLWASLICIKDDRNEWKIKDKESERWGVSGYAEKGKKEREKEKTKKVVKKLNRWKDTGS